MHEEEAVEEVTAKAINRHNGEDIFEDAPDAIEVQEHLVRGCSRFGCRVTDAFAQVVLCAHPICNRIMHVEC